MGDAGPSEMKVYVVTVKSHPWLLPPVEDALRNSDVGAAGDVSKLARNILLQQHRHACVYS